MEHDAWTQCVVSAGVFVSWAGRFCQWSGAAAVLTAATQRVVEVERHGRVGELPGPLVLPRLGPCRRGVRSAQSRGNRRTGAT
jgi:hypothetical protein